MPSAALAPTSKDLIFNPAGGVHDFRNNGVADAESMLLASMARAGDVDRAVESRDWGGFGTELNALRPLLEELSPHSSGLSTPAKGPFME